MSFTSGNLESSYTPIAAGSSPFDNFDERKKKNTKGGQYAHPPDLLNVGGLDDETFGPIRELVDQWLFLEILENKPASRLLQCLFYLYLED